MTTRAIHRTAADRGVSNVFDTWSEAAAFRDEHLEGAPATTWPSVTPPSLTRVGQRSSRRGRSHCEGSRDRFP